MEWLRPEVIANEKEHGKKAMFLDGGAVSNDV